MKRREILRYTALATGSAICMPLLNALLTGCATGERQQADGYRPQFFTEDQFELLKTLVDTILPKTDSPCATDVSLHQTIDSIVNTVYKPGEKEAYKVGFAELESYLKGKDFVDQDQEERVLILKTLDHAKVTDTVNRAFVHLKQQTIAFYLSSEAIAKQYLNYLPVPGEYESCTSLSDVGGKAWAIK